MESVVPVKAEFRESIPFPATPRAFTLAFVPEPDWLKNSVVVFNIIAAEFAISENACTVPAAEDKSVEICASAAERLSAIV